MTNLTENLQIVLKKNGEPVDLASHPSLLAMLHATNRAVVSIEAQIHEKEQQIEELREAITLREDMKMPVRGTKALLTRRFNEVEKLRRRRDAHEDNYLEVPRQNGIPVDIDGEDWGDSLPSDLPLDVLRALKHAYDGQVFDNFQVYYPTMPGVDPMLVGIAGDAAFYVASWR